MAENGTTEKNDTLFERYSIIDIEQYLRLIHDKLAQGTPKDAIKRALDITDFNELYEIALTRDQAYDKTSKPFYLTRDDLRFATNELVAAYRAKRLACQTLVEIGAGIGLQTVAFAKTCAHVIAIEIDPRKTSYLEANLKLHHITNVTIITGDCLDVVDRIDHADVIFCDPERAPTEDERSISTIQPHLPKVIELYGKLTDKIAIELPPQIHDIPFDCEREYTSVNHELNRLTVYLGSLKNQDASAILLPGEWRLEKEAATEKKTEKKPEKKAGRYLAELDDAIVAAGLADQLPGANWKNNIGAFHTADTLADLGAPAFSKHRYRVRASCSSEQDFIQTLHRERIGKITYRANVKPSDYWSTRNKIEKGLTGRREAVVLISGKEWLLAEELGRNR